LIIGYGFEIRETLLLEATLNPRFCMCKIKLKLKNIKKGLNLILACNSGIHAYKKKLAMDNLMISLDSWRWGLDLPQEVKAFY